MKGSGVLILDKCPMKDEVWLILSPHWGSEVTGEGKPEVLALGR